LAGAFFDLDGQRYSDIEYALRGMSQPLGVSQFELLNVLPAELEGVLPTVAHLEADE
jgi:hypothetical protein